MKAEIKVPGMGESVSEATVGQILKNSGTVVKMDEEVLELETDKANQALFAPQAGVLTLTVKAGDVVKIDQVVGYVETNGGGEAAAPQKEEAKEEKKEPPKQEPPKKEVPKEEPPKQEPPKQAPQPQEKGENARLGKEEFVASLNKPAEAPKKQMEPAKQTEVAKSAPSGTPDRPETRRKMSKIRKVIAQRLVEVQATTAMLTTFNEIDMSEVMAIREKHKDQFLKEHNVKLGFMSFFVKAVVSALQAYPDVNAYIDGDDIVNREYYDIGIAVSTDKGLMVPVIRGCNHLSFAGIEKAIEDQAKKARTGSITAGDLQGGGFTITNGGIYGSLLSTPILNPPQSAILGMHKILKRPIAVNDQVVIRPMMYLALSYDHRLIDGKEAVSFLVHVKDFLEDPARLLLEQ